MDIYNALKLNLNNREVISFVGGGGKTTTIFKLGEEFKKLDKKVLITTTTKIYEPKENYDYYFLGNITEDFRPTNGSITIIGEKIEGEKLIGLSLEKLDKLIEAEIFDYILIEADGAKKLPIKAMGEDEPIVSKYSTKTIGIIGIDALDKEIANIVHRPELFTKIVEKKLNEKVKEEDIVRLILYSEGLFKNARGEKIFLLNKVEEKDIFRAEKIRAELQKENFQGEIILANIMENKFY
ncbi:MAG: putative selenium-dependent hydroxylase accessory protein YqeC [Tissierellia bacterium]|nr:putative selenium-dependent hydroxylase accessory protein YqeC [Tissierellia bacterium]